MIFPNLENKIFGYVNLDIEAKDWSNNNGINLYDKNILIDPINCQNFIEDVHKKYNLDFSYGGWMENREFLWNGWYLDKDKTYIHLGIDLNVPAGTEIATDFKSEVVKIDNDYPLDGGWGPHIILKNLSKNVYLLYAHLNEKILCKEGDILEVGTIFAKVGFAPNNGNWFPHLHIQVISEDYYIELNRNNDWEKFDGYGLRSDIQINSKKHIDPMGFINLK